MLCNVFYKAKRIRIFIFCVNNLLRLCLGLTNSSGIFYIETDINSQRDVEEFAVRLRK